MGLMTNMSENYSSTARLFWNWTALLGLLAGKDHGTVSPMVAIHIITHCLTDS